MKFKRGLAFAVAMMACGDDARSGDRGNKAVTHAPYTLCDGSDGIRLALTSGGGGPLPEDHAYSHPYDRLLYVDGKCNFVTNAEANGKLLFGRFSTEQGKTVSDALALEDIAGIVYRSQQSGCPDAPMNVLATPEAYLEGVCGDQPPSEVAAALAWEPVFALAKSVAEPWTGNVSIAARPSDIPHANAALWAFDFPIEQAVGATPFEKTLTGAEAAKARELWATLGAQQGWETHLPIVSGDKTYRLYFRDELDAAFVAKRTEFWTRYNLGGARPVARCDASRLLVARPTNAVVHGVALTASVAADTPCAAELCWEGNFKESYPVQTSIALQRPAQVYTCPGAPYLSVSASLQPIVDAFRAAYPQAPVEVDLGDATLYDSEGDDALCRAHSVASCGADPRCSPIVGSLHDATRGCTVPGVALGCKAKLRGCDAALTGGQSPDGRRALFTSGCLPEGWTAFYGEAPDYTLPACAP